jgi:hypothetical protein
MNAHNSQGAHTDLLHFTDSPRTYRMFSMVHEKPSIGTGCDICVSGSSGSRRSNEFNLCALRCVSSGDGERHTMAWSGTERLGSVGWLGSFLFPLNVTFSVYV